MENWRSLATEAMTRSRNRLCIPSLPSHRLLQVGGRIGSAVVGALIIPLAMISVATVGNVRFDDLDV